MPENARSDSGRNRRLELACGLALAIVVGLVWDFYRTELASTLAASAQTPWPMVDRWLDPELRALDPACHADELPQSLYMRGFLLTEILGIDRTISMAASMLIGFILVALGSVALVRSFRPEASPVAWLLFATWNLATLVPKVDLANFGGGLSASGQMYAPAFGLGLMAIAAVFRRAWVAFGLLVAAASLCHLVVAFCVAAIGVAMAIPEVRRRNPARFILGLLIALGVSGAWSYGVLAGLPEQMSKADWMRHARFGNSHWFPFDLGIFGRLHHWNGATIYLCVCLAGMVAIGFVSERLRRTQWWLGVAMAAALTTIGLAAGLVSNEPFLIKLGLHRASAMITQLSLLVVVLFLIDSMRSRGPSAWLSILVLLYTAVHGFSPFSTTVLLVAMCIETPSKRRWIPGVAVAVLVGWVLSIWYRDHLGSWSQVFLGTSHRAAWQRLVIMWGSAEIDISASTIRTFMFGAWIVLGLTHQIFDRRAHAASPGTLATSLVVLALALASTSTAGWMRVHDRSTPGRDRHGDFLEAQLWATENTVPRELFFVDPADEYGFREYSGRPTFGTPREWVHTSFLYTGSQQAFAEGRRRSLLFEVDPDDFMEAGSTYQGYVDYRTAIRSAIHAKDPQWFSNLANQEGFDYVVMRVENSVAWSEVPPVFENESYRIFDLSKEVRGPLGGVEPVGLESSDTFE